jgi:hypothetical protein
MGMIVTVIAVGRLQQQEEQVVQEEIKCVYRLIDGEMRNIPFSERLS